MTVHQMTTVTKFWEQKQLEVDNIYLTKKNEYLVNENSCIKWYIEVLEGGQDTKEVIELYAKLKQRHTKLEAKHEATVKKLKDSL